MNLTGIKDLDFKILNELDDKSLVKYCSTNKKANEICSNELFWMNRILTKFPFINIKILQKYKGKRSWSDYYINDLRKVTPNIKYLLSEDGRLDRIMIAVSLGVDFRFVDGLALTSASQLGYLEIVKYLVSLGLNVNPKNGRVIAGASFGGHLDIVKYLVSQGADIRAINDKALKKAIYKGHLDIAKYLISQGADIRNATVDIAYRKGHLDVLDYLVSQGASDPRTLNN